MMVSRQSEIRTRVWRLAGARRAWWNRLGQVGVRPGRVPWRKLPVSLIWKRRQRSAQPLVVSNHLKQVVLTSVFHLHALAARESAERHTTRGSVHTHAPARPGARIIERSGYGQLRSPLAQGKDAKPTGASTVHVAWVPRLSALPGSRQLRAERASDSTGSTRLRRSAAQLEITRPSVVRRTPHHEQPTQAADRLLASRAPLHGEPPAGHASVTSVQLAYASLARRLRALTVRSEPRTAWQATSASQTGSRGIGARGAMRSPLTLARDPACDAGLESRVSHQPTRDPAPRARTAELRWRTARAPDEPCAARSKAIPQSAAPPHPADTGAGPRAGVRPAAPSHRGTSTAKSLLGNAELERLADDLLHRIERRMRIGRERRGL